MQHGSGTTIAGKYTLEGLLATGGMGEIWVAQHEQLDTRVAIKFMSEELARSASARSRFEREAKAAAALRSPNVVQVFDFGVEGETPYIVLELLQGQDLRSRIQQYGRLGLDEAVHILTQICRALRLAAEAGIVHRDLKPSNIYIARSGEEEVVKILDFGVAKALRAPVAEGTATGTLLGSPHYMSPEQARGGKLDHRSDLFSVAVMLFHMVTGQKPFPGEEIGDVLVKICSDPLPIATEVNPGLPESLNRFFQRALARVPAERFQSGGAMAYEFALLVARHFGLPEPPGDVLQSQSLHHTPSGGGPGGSGAALTPPADTKQTAATELTVTTPPEDWSSPGAEPVDAASTARWGGAAGAPVAGQASEQAPPGGTTSRTIGTLAKLGELRRRGRWTSLWAALAGALAAGVLVHVLTGTATETEETSPTAAPIPETTATSSPNRGATAPASSDGGAPAAPVPATVPTASASATGSASALPPAPLRPPRPPRPTATKDGKHPVLGI